MKKPSAYDLTQIALSTALLAVASIVVLPIGVIPITLQVFFFLFIPALLGPVKGLMTIILYIIMGLIGLPVFAGGSGGIGSILSPSFGYIIGALIVAWIVGRGLLNQRSKLQTLGIMSMGLGALYVIGMTYQYMIMTYFLQTPISFMSIMSVNFSVFLPIDMLKMILAVGLYGRLVKLPFAKRIDKL
ncbi:biotin transporter BioY [Alkalibacterium olivapovliticus]|uniref:biotin transporter BioY n=1 Tax=Alkalibacterium olivapovliticus TaxID=99907 RepID=UPI0014734BD6|nr:biotin transporter BioY [Alkalibacterium olivapovliticus]